MFRYQILIEYDGSKFVGWQKQKNGTSIQSTIEKVFKKILKKNSFSIWFRQNRCRCSRG